MHTKASAQNESSGNQTQAHARAHARAGEVRATQRTHACVLQAAANLRGLPPLGLGLQSTDKIQIPQA